jgi:hypothetical protein
MNWIQRVPRGLLWLSFALIVPAAAGSQDIPCIYEIRSYCAEVKPGEGRLLRCLKSHAAQMTPACSQRFEEVDTLLTETLAPCHEDWVEYCFDVRGLGGAESMVRCLRTHREQVSPACRKALPTESHMPGQPAPSIVP